MFGRLLVRTHHRQTPSALLIKGTSSDDTLPSGRVTVGLFSGIGFRHDAHSNALLNLEQLIDAHFGDILSGDNNRTEGDVLMGGMGMIGSGETLEMTG